MALNDRQQSRPLTPLPNTQPPPGPNPFAWVSLPDKYDGSPGKWPVPQSPQPQAAGRARLPRRGKNPDGVYGLGYPNGQSDTIPAPTHTTFHSLIHPDSHSFQPRTHASQENLSEEERAKRIRHNLCLYCGQPGHIRSSCPVCPARNAPNRVSQAPSEHSMTIPITLIVQGREISTTAFIDLGTEGNFIGLPDTLLVPSLPVKLHDSHTNPHNIRKHRSARN